MKQTKKAKKAYDANRYITRSEEMKSAHVEWYAANPEKAKAYAKAWRAANPEKAKATDRARYAANPEKAKAASKAWCKRNPEKRVEYRHERRAHLSTYAECEKLNAWFDECDGHHVDPDTIMHIPTSLHQLVSHNSKTWEGMEEMNRVAFDWLSGVRRKSPQTTLDIFDARVLITSMSEMRR